MIRIGKVASYRESLLKDFVAMEFSTIIKGNGFEFIFMLMNSFRTSSINFFDGSSLYFLDDNKTRFSFYQGDDTVMAIIPNDCIAFPMADIGTVINIKRAVLNHTFSG